MYFGMKLQATKYKKRKRKIPRQIVSNCLKTSDKEKILKLMHNINTWRKKNKNDYLII